MKLPSVKLAPKLRPLPDLGEHQVTAAQLATNGMDGDNPIYKSDHIGRIIAVRQGETIIAGPLRSLMDSVTEPYLILEIGDFHQKVVLHPTDPVSVAPDGHRLAIVSRPVETR